MPRWFARSLALAAFSIMGVACIAVPDEAEILGESTEALVPAPGCFGHLVGCPAGTKTCGAWGAWASCSEPVCGQYASCYNGGDFGNVCGRSSCNSGPGWGDPQNEARTCTMNATGLVCVQYDYRVALASCGCN